MKQQLYYYPGNANLAPHILLEEAGCEFELVLVDRSRNLQKSAQYLRLNPNGRIPTLVSGEFVLFEAAAICLHIAERYPSARLAPPVGSNQRSLFHQWMFYLSNTVQPAYMAFRYPEQFTASASPSALEDVRMRATRELERAFEVIEPSLQPGPFMLGTEYSACDAYLCMVSWWTARRLPQVLRPLPRLRACVEAVAARPAARRAAAAEGIELRFDID